jgi:hypothetical protein
MNETNLKPKNLVIGVAANYSFEQLKPFLYSLKQTGYEGDVCFLVANLEASTLRTLQALGVITIPLGQRWLRKPLADWIDISTILSPPKKRQQIKFRTAASSLSIFGSRFFDYYSFLLECGKAYSNVMLTDIRDVVFQRDPFDFDIDRQLCVFLEEITIKDCPYDSDWVIQTFGRKGLKELGDKIICCAGVTIGSYDSIISYLKLMTDYMIRLRSKLSQLQICDQAVHNKIIYEDSLKELKIFRNRYAPVMTMGTMDKSMIQLDHEGFVLNDDSTIANVLHQYDRHLDIQERLIKIYV